MQLDCIEDLCRSRYPQTKELRQVGGVGALTSLAYILSLEDPARFRKSRELGPFLGMVPRQNQSGGADPQLRITKTGDAYLRRLLVGSAQYILGPFGPDCDLRRWGLRLAERGGTNAKKRAVVGVARKLAVLLHRLWLTGEDYQPLRQITTAAQPALTVNQRSKGSFLARNSTKALREEPSTPSSRSSGSDCPAPCPVRATAANNWAGSTFRKPTARWQRPPELGPQRAPSPKGSPRVRMEVWRPGAEPADQRGAVATSTLDNPSLLMEVVGRSRFNAKGDAQALVKSRHIQMSRAAIDVQNAKLTGMPIMRSNTS